MDENELKGKSLEDNIYFTLRDIFWNGDSEQCMTANHFNSILTNNISFEERDKNFKYANVLHDYNSNYTKQLYNFLQIFKKISMFDFLELEEGEDIDMDYYMKYDDWWHQFEQLLGDLANHMLKYHEQTEVEN